MITEDCTWSLLDSRDMNAESKPVHKRVRERKLCVVVVGSVFTKAISIRVVVKDELSEL